MITPQLDLFSIYIFLGSIQGLFLSFLFFQKKEGNRLSNTLLGCVLFSLSIIILDIFSGYSGYIIYFIYLNNTTEPLVFLIGPLFYFYTCVETSVLKKLSLKQYLHFIPALFWALYIIMYILQPNELKYNDFLRAFHPDIKTPFVNPIFEPDPLGLLRNTNELIITSITIYLFLTYRVLSNVMRKKGSSFLAFKNSEFRWLRVLLSGFVLALLLLISTKLLMEADLGDHIIATYTSFMIYSISFYIARQSNFLNTHEAGRVKKYEKSSLTPEMREVILNKLHLLMKRDKPFLDNGFSHPLLAKQLSVSTHHLSQILNEDIKKTFFEYVAEFRVREAQSLLQSKNRNLVIEEIAEQVGYNSKSAFNNAFKKVTGLTPSQFRDKFLNT